ncbi:MAG: succinate dehydrogenase cytochrome b subunit [Intrasporangium sp.]|uniref:succinate dehydrogenase cytochrome b subunit n=1 Tax=Intrasporangium sp. TaxID=1925024 RepID=UPI0026475FD2|nr:succinate dehydrogenase cytochrome b subunit [Intrasporangium sp.]MDN5798080.1 succinate dehydrogenase cytochrome b subunit [Intrasporangium sp.]
MQSTPPIAAADRAALRPRTMVPSWALKVTMAVSGLTWLAFVLVHLVGNLKVYAGASAFNAYAAWLREVLVPLAPHGGVLWALRVVLAVLLVAHVWAAAILTARARSARGPHRARLHSWRSFVASTMPVTGLVILGFIVLHLLDLTLGVQPVAPSAFRAEGSGAFFAHENLVASLSRPWSAAVYILTMLLLAGHVLHGTTVAVQDLGGMGRTLRAGATWVGAILAVAILLGNAGIPIAVLLGVVT